MNNTTIIKIKISNRKKIEILVL